MSNLDADQNTVALYSILSIAVESWRFAKLFNRLLSKLDAGEQNRYTNQFRWFLKKVEEL